MTSIDIDHVFEMNHFFLNHIEWISGESSDSEYDQQWLWSGICGEWEEKEEEEGGEEEWD